MNRKKILDTYKREGALTVIKNTFYRLSYYFIRFFERKSKNNQWGAVKNKYKGRRVFLLGNGPSLNETPLFMLKDEYVICFNRFYIMRERLNWTPKFYMCVDNLVLEDLAPEIEEIVKDIKYAFFPDRHFRNKNIKKRFPNLPNILWMKPIFGTGFSNHLPKVNLGGSVIYEGMQVMNYLGFDEIILLGVDMNFQIHQTAKPIGNVRGTDITSQDDDDPNHFDPRYFGKGRSYHQPKKHVIENIIKNLNFIGENQKKYNTNIINAGLNSKVYSFPKKDFLSFFNKTKDEVRQLFDELMIEKAGITSSEFESEFAFVEDENGLKAVDRKTSFYSTKDYGLKLISNKVYHYIALGPYDNKYYFILKE